VTSTPTPDRRRAAYIDWTRGLAVLLMIEAHTLDAWTRAASRTSAAYGYGAILAGFAAPLFLWLAGVSIPLAAAAGVRRGLSRAASAEAVVRRGVEIFILAFLFRVQAFILSPGAHPVTIFRVDILNIMGPAIVVAGLVWLLCESKTAMVVTCSLLAAGVSMLTPIIRHLAALDALPRLVQWYIRPAGDNTTFTSFPWIGFVFAGAAVGGLLTSVREKPAERRLLTGIGAAGVLLIAGGFYAASRPSLYADSYFWTTSPAYFAIRAGVLMTTMALLFGAGEIVEVVAAPVVALRMLAQFGRSSLFVYWIHVELVYGYASWAIHRRLPLWGTAFAYVLFTALMYGAVVLRDRLADRWWRRKQQITLQYEGQAV
jgi:uncharacterized membrane protein